jgi:hypothetical protein
MADGSDISMTAGPTTTRNVPPGLVEGLRSFAAGHGGATAVIEYAGRRGARIVLVGEDGNQDDQLAESTDVARVACERAGVAVENEWERELIEQMRPANDLWRSMGRRILSR